MFSRINSAAKTIMIGMIFCYPVCMAAQPTHGKEKQGYTESRISVTNKAMDEGKLHIKTLDSLIIRETKNGQKTINRTCDSLCASDTRAALRPVKMRLKTIQKDAESKIATLYSQWEQFLEAISNTFSKNLRQLQDQENSCRGCTAQSQENRLHLYEKHTGAVVDSLIDTLYAAADNDTAALHDACNDACTYLKETWEAGRDRVDSIQAIMDSLTEAVSSDGDSVNDDKEDYSKLVAETQYQSHITYRGRDFGVAQAGVTPQLVFQHKTGFSIGFAPTWYQNFQYNWNEFNVSASYERDLTNLISGSINYDHIWFADTSLHDQSDLNNSLSLGLVIRPKHFEFEVITSLSFGLLTEATFQFNVSYAIGLIRLTHPVDIVIKPAASALYGQENQNFFGVLDYEFSFPIALEYRSISVMPMMTYIIPLNIHDDSQQAPFFSLGATVNISLNLFR